MTGDGRSTDVEVVTDLAITGKPAQFGRGVMQDVSDKLLGQFVACLEQRFEGCGRCRARRAGRRAHAAGRGARPDADRRVGPAAVERRLRHRCRRPRLLAPPPAPSDDALNLGSTVLPVLLKTYWKQALAALVVLAIIIWLIAAL